MKSTRADSILPKPLQAQTARPLLILWIGLCLALAGFSNVEPASWLRAGKTKAAFAELQASRAVAVSAPFQPSIVPPPSKARFAHLDFDLVLSKSAEVLAAASIRYLPETSVSPLSQAHSAGPKNRDPPKA